jgi:hypothetical protein
MSRSRFSLRHALFGASFAGCMAFGSAQAFATSNPVPIPVSCDPYDRFSSVYCSEACGDGYSRGFCGGNGGCYCVS